MAMLSLLRSFGLHCFVILCVWVYIITSLWMYVHCQVFFWGKLTCSVMKALFKSCQFGSTFYESLEKRKHHHHLQRYCGTCAQGKNCVASREARCWGTTLKTCPFLGNRFVTSNNGVTGKRCSTKRPVR
jgi:hypothetical protein